MAREITAHIFWIVPVNDPAQGVKDAVVRFMRNPRAFEFDHKGYNYLAEGFSWDNRSEILTGTIYRIRSTGLPRAVEGTRTRDLPLGANETLGEPMCFAFMPDPGCALIHYAHTGPRHTVMGAMITGMRYPNAIQIEPMLKTDTLLRLGQKTIVTGLEFTLTDPDGVAELRAMGGSVQHAIQMMEGIDGVKVKVQISASRAGGDGLALRATKQLARRLAQIGTIQDSPVRGVKVRGADEAGDPTEVLDMLKAREVVPLQIQEQARHLDLDDCHRKLSNALRERRDQILQQVGEP